MDWIEFKQSKNRSTSEGSSLHSHMCIIGLSTLVLLSVEIILLCSYTVLRNVRYSGKPTFTCTGTVWSHDRDLATGACFCDQKPPHNTQNMRDDSQPRTEHLTRHHPSGINYCEALRFPLRTSTVQY
jgi:hypothetical protein